MNGNRLRLPLFAVLCLGPRSGYFLLTFMLFVFIMGSPTSSRTCRRSRLQLGSG